MKLHSNIYHTILALVMLCLISSCGEKNDNRNNPAFLEELANRELKKVSDADIMQAAYARGKGISSAAQTSIFAALQEQIDAEGIQNALKFCNTKAYPLTDSIAAATGAEIRRVSLKTRNKSNAPDSLESMLLDSYLYNVENNLALDDNIQKVDEEYLLYTKPIVLNNPLCLQCHGDVGKDISAENYETIKSLYPQDAAIGYNVGDFRGMWSIKLSKKKLIKAL